MADIVDSNDKGENLESLLDDAKLPFAIDLGVND